MNLAKFISLPHISAMHDALPISCFLITCNEGDRLARTLQSVAGLVDEIVVVDSGSQDDTLEIAARFGARTMHRDWEGFGPQKRFAEDHCRHDWVLNLDADEVLTPELVAEIRSLFAHGMPTIPGWRFAQVTVYPGQSRPRLWADRHNYIRLYDRKVMRFSNAPSHDAVEPGMAKVGQLQACALHFSWRSLDHLREKYASYTDLQAETLRPKPWAILVMRSLLEYPAHFLKVWIGRRHFTGGWHGLAVAHIIASARQARIWKLLRARSRKN